MTGSSGIWESSNYSLRGYAIRIRVRWITDFDPIEAYAAPRIDNVAIQTGDFFFLFSSNHQVLTLYLILFYWLIRTYYIWPSSGFRGMFVTNDILILPFIRLHLYGLGKGNLVKSQCGSVCWINFNFSEIIFFNKNIHYFHILFIF